MDKRKGMIVQVYKDASGTDCSNGGLSSRHTRLLLIGPTVPAIFEESDDLPVVELGKAGNRVHVRPADIPAGDVVGPMFGGAFVYSSDSRFAEATGSNRPLHLHDRFETQEQYDALSS